MRLVLDAHPEIRCHDEGPSYHLLGRGPADAYRSKALVGFKVPQLTEQLDHATLRDDLALRTGTTGIPNPYGGEKIIFMIRDVRDVVASMMNLEHWLEQCGRSVLDAQIRTNPAFRARYATEIRRLETSAMPDVVAGALIWRYKSDAMFDYIERHHPVLPVWYESLVDKPEQELLRVCGFLQTSWSAQLLDHAARYATLRVPAGRTTGGTDPARPIDSASVHRWHDSVGDEELAEILETAGDTFVRLYQSSTTAASALA